MAGNTASSPGGAGSRLRAALTDHQLEILLDVAAETGHLRALDERLRSVDADLAATVGRMLDQPVAESGLTPSCEKTIELWNHMWASWAGHVGQVGEEKGPYVNHKEHWHPPYFDHSGLAADLEKDADKLSAWIDRAFPLRKEPDLFLRSLAELSENVGSFPTWFQPVEDRFVLGPRATGCVLRWTWLGIANEPAPGRTLVDAVREAEAPTRRVGLNREAVCRFFTELPENVCREVHTYLNEAEFADYLADLRSVWHRIHHAFAGRFDHAAYLRECEEHLEQDWRYGEPLIADAAARRDFQAAERFVELTLCSLIGWSGEALWRPEKRLLPRARYYRAPEADQALLRLLERWEDLAGQLGKPERAAALRFQRLVWETPEAWSTVLEGFEEYRRRLSKPGAAEPLFAEWRQRMADACAHAECAKGPAKDTWTHRLIDALRDPSADEERFLDQAQAWVRHCLEQVAFFHKNWRSLALLTRALPQYGDLKGTCPTMHSQVLVPALQIDEELEKSLREALASLGEKANRIKVRAVWARHLHSLVPSPGSSSGSYYGEPALWMKALSEVNPGVYAGKLAHWKTEFRRRRNLWADMASAGCPGLD